MQCIPGNALRNPKLPIRITLRNAHFLLESTIQTLISYWNPLFRPSFPIGIHYRDPDFLLETLYRPRFPIGIHYTDPDFLLETLYRPRFPLRNAIQTPISSIGALSKGGGKCKLEPTKYGLEPTLAS